MYAIYGDMDPINIPQMLAYIPYMDPMGYGIIACSGNSHCSYMAFSGINIINMLLLYDGK
jgi:hypothetical protein